MTNLDIILKSRDITLQTPSSQFSSVAQLCPTLCEPMDRSMPGLPVHHKLPEFAKLGQSPCEMLGGLSGFLSRRSRSLRPCVESVQEPDACSTPGHLCTVSTSQPTDETPPRCVTLPPATERWKCLSFGLESN